MPMDVWQPGIGFVETTGSIFFRTISDYNAMTTERHNSSRWLAIGCPVKEWGFFESFRRLKSAKRVWSMACPQFFVFNFKKMKFLFDYISILKKGILFPKIAFIFEKSFWRSKSKGWRIALASPPRVSSRPICRGCLAEVLIEPLSSGMES